MDIEKRAQQIKYISLQENLRDRWQIEIRAKTLFQNKFEGIKQGDVYYCSPCSAEKFILAIKFILQHES